MLVFLIPIVLGFIAIALIGVGSWLGNAQLERWCFRHEGACNVTVFFSLAALTIMLLFLIGNRIDYASFPAQYGSVKATLNTARTDSNTDIERAAILHKVIDMNKELAAVKYWNDSIWIGWFWPGKVAKLEYIK
jgi:hypothetical protein